MNSTIFKNRVYNYFHSILRSATYMYGKGWQREEHMDYLSVCNAQTGLEFIARVISHIPDKGQVMIRYYSLYSNAHRGKMRKAGIDPFHPPIIEEEHNHVSSKGWAEMIQIFPLFITTDPVIFM